MAAEALKQNILFQRYLMNEKVKVQRKLKSKIFPSTRYEDYEIIDILGEGSFGKVVQAQNISSKKVFALKIIAKKNLVENQQLMHLKSEIRILNSVSFEFLISLECYFTNPCYVFIVLPCVKGGHFFKLLRRVKMFDENIARFFAGQIVLAMEYLHYMGIIHRDLKPENLLLDLEGYLKIIDYGFAKHIGINRSYTFCGTPEYIAPEILLRMSVYCLNAMAGKLRLADFKGYTMSSDWWTLGILIYEMCNGSPPFTSSNHLKLYERILGGKINWPEHFSHELKSIVQGLLQVDRSKRLGCMKKRVQDIKFHRWFSSLNWNDLWKRKILPPFTLSVNQNKETSKIPTILNFSLKNCKNFIPSEMIENIDFLI